MTKKMLEKEKNDIKKKNEKKRKKRKKRKKEKKKKRRKKKKKRKKVEKMEKKNGDMRMSAWFKENVILEELEVEMEKKVIVSVNSQCKDCIYSFLDLDFSIYDDCSQVGPMESHAIDGSVNGVPYFDVIGTTEATGNNETVGIWFYVIPVCNNKYQIYKYICIFVYIYLLLFIINLFL
ncbi:hypothetical protein RFI_36663 [Reticulomyxa filosa]|uniref:Uncharacterized protein n=1 Tax=Reticulomyxa filosa TaxID=46433 RepID=X6LI10_RETFI|nr:hypothetical protein RFI_36663 [Reticulomyxa filosa]|eukprot:ETO00777.1 hypothetical protein RFI_36663 [Reticulomyxa filosa]